MLKNYIKIAWRNLWKHKVFSVVNIWGLSIGLTAFWLIVIYIANELSYDRHYKDAKQIYRVVSHAKWNGGAFDITGTSAPFAPALKKHFPEIEKTVRIGTEGGGVIRVNTQSFREDAICFADRTLFDVFSYHLLYGNPKSALANPNSIVLSKSLATKLFGVPAKALNRTIYFENNYPNQVTGVIEDIPANSHFTFQAVRSLPTNFSEGWGELHMITYLKFSAKADINKVKARLPAFVNTYLKPRFAAEGMDVDYRIELQPLTSIHLQSKLVGEVGPNGSMNYIYIFSIIGLLVLIIASINYVNLSTARSSLRIREIGVRKVTGSSRTQLIFMFFTEAFLITIIATFISVVVIHLTLPWFNQFTGKEIDIWYFGVSKTLLILLSFTLLIGCMSGIYPALFLSGFKLIPALKGQSESSRWNGLFRKSTVAFQFVITISMISGSLIIYQQLQYVLKKDLGFKEDQVLTFHLEGNELRTKVTALKEELIQNPLIQKVASAGITIGNNYESFTTYKVSNETQIAHYLPIDDDFAPTLQLRMVAGRNYTKIRPSDQIGSLMVNEAFVKESGLKDPIGKQISLDTIRYTIIGVVKDFHFLSLQKKIEPLVMPLASNTGEADNLYVRVSAENIPEALKYIEQTYRKFDKTTPFDYSFLDENFAKQYKTEQKQGSLLIMFTMLAISIACLGLFGLVTFMIEQRVEEIGIRKVLGASATSIVALLSSDFLKLVLISLLLASPLAWWVMNRWLENFAYRIEIRWWMFALAGSVAVTIALLTISFQAVKAAMSNPIKSLRTE
ncbi:MAG TPA: ABC transporter permease [Pedobacter sp.]|jgi:putative ABC transport system permease protein